MSPSRPASWYDLQLDDMPEGLLYKQYQVIVSRCEVLRGATAFVGER